MIRETWSRSRQQSRNIERFSGSGASIRRGRILKTILVVDDSATDRVRITGLLKRNPHSDDSAPPYQIEVASNGADALALLEQTSVDLVLTDLHMPELEGLELVRKMKEDWSHIPVIVMTGVGSEEVAVKAMQEGAASYVNKTSASSWLHENVERVLESRVEDLAYAALCRRIVSDEYHLSLNNDRVLMSATARFLRQAVQSAGVVSDAELPRVGIAMEEALLNACLHGNLELDSSLREGDGNEFDRLARERSAAAPWMDRRVTVTAAISPCQLRVEISDEGQGFNPEALPDPTAPENLLKPHGRGVMMMKLFLDAVSWNEQGNTVTLIKNGPKA